MGTMTMVMVRRARGASGAAGPAGPDPVGMAPTR